MTDEQMEKMMELMADKAAAAAMNLAQDRWEKDLDVASRAAALAMDNAKEVWRKDIKIHSNECALNKYMSIRTFFVSVITAVIVVLANFLITKIKW